ncbi:DUF503 domain-containing protein [Clostridium botulinum]|uniref:DUF503 domain-containing protein n=1 Tax=Clostridium botulinum TaxID=1491 RepID=UPI001C9B3889|nr:DUF503 domain-containing protein [Clostridium botulinum]MBY6946725.1 DUF503 domain-containing protein [Clostridium botulinum]MBY7020354.1 DUF503 domain-containing protein [Clostridium botulinum]
MKILILKITLRASWVSSLKEKRMIIKSLIQRLKNKFNISVSEIDAQDIHKTVVIGMVGICGNSAQVDSTAENIIEFIDSNTDAEIIHIEKDQDIL